MTPEEFKKLREKTGLTQAQLAETIDVGQAYISHLESGRRAVPHDGLWRLALVNLAKKKGNQKP